MKRLTFIFVLLSVIVNAQMTRLVPLQYSTIQEAISVSGPGDTVLVAPGTYYEQINFMGKPITVASHYLLDPNPDYIATTIIDGDSLPIHNSSVVVFESGEDTTSILNGFTIRNGKGSVFNSIYLNGGGVLMLYSGGKIINNRFTNNILDGVQQLELAAAGAAIATQIDTASNWIVIMNNTIENNHCISHNYDAAGGAIITFSNTRLINNIITNNSVITSGPGSGYANVFAKSAFSPPNNTMIAIGNEITYNSVASPNIVRGSGMICASIHSIILNNEISHNQLKANFGGVNYGGAGIFFEYPLSATIKGNTFHHNVGDGFGGALYLRGNADVNFEIQDNYFTNNQCNNGGAIYTYRAPVTFINNVFNNNSAVWSSGGAIFLNSPTPYISAAKFINNSFSGNSAAVNGGAIFDEGVNTFILNSIFWNDTAMNGNEIMYWNLPGNIAYCDIDTAHIEGPCTYGLNNMCCNPQFCDSTLALPYDTSMCVNSGVPIYTFSGDITLAAPDHDIRLYPRPLGGNYDMGAYEASGVGVKKYTTTSPFDVYPNPFTDYFTLRYNLKKSAHITADLFDFSGRRIQLLYTGFQPTGPHTLTIKPKELPTGAYSLRMNVDGTVEVMKVMKQ